MLIFSVMFKELQGATMFRYTFLLCSSMLLYGCSASPFKSWEKEADPALQETRSNDFDEKMTLGLKEVEPQEELDLTRTNIDPKMLIWKAFKQLQLQRYENPEQDKDQVYHPFEAMLTSFNKQPDTYVQPQQSGQARLYQKPEQDMDDLYHGKPEKFEESEKPVQTGAKHRADTAEASGSVKYQSPEEDKDGLYHGSFQSESIAAAPVMHAFDSMSKNVYTEPEEDLDHLYHS